MTDFVSRQDVFDSQVALSATEICMLLDFSKVWEKHEDSIRKDGLTDKVFAEYKDMAMQYDVEYRSPRENTKFLKLVDREGQSPTVH
jgi:ACT domain-containing protein